MKPCEGLSLFIVRTFSSCLLLVFSFSLLVWRHFLGTVATPHNTQTVEVKHTFGQRYMGTESPVPRIEFSKHIERYIALCIFDWFQSFKELSSLFYYHFLN